MLPTLGREYLVTALEANPDVLEHLLGALAPDDARWDARPDPERFTLREVIAHLAVNGPNWEERLQRTLDEDTPTFPRTSQENAEALARTPRANLADVRASRQRLVALLRDLDAVQWERSARSEILGLLNVEQQAVYISAHDGYHLKHIVEWLDRTA